MMFCYMAKPNFPEKQTTWGTWEELLLACAVHRYGADSWDSVASELRKRTSAPHLLTPFACKQKYLDLKRRFSQNAVVPSVAADAGAAGVASIPFLDELRILRVAELRREVERYDLSIVSLESKVEKLKEERQQSLKEREEKADLEKEGKDRETKPEHASPENTYEKAVSGEGSVHDERSVDESNSTNLKDDVAETGGAGTGKEPERAEPAGGEPDRTAECGKPAVEDSYDGSSETIAKGSAAVSPVRESEKVNSEKDGGGDSAESKGGEEGTKEVCSSEMQSSTSLPRKKVEEPDEPDAEDQSAATKGAHHDVESKALIDFLEILRSHRSGSFFQRRLDVQETPNYINMIRQHIDFEMVRIRLEEGWYSGCKSKFFRDVLLILNNAIVFFRRKSPESMAAIELRLLVLKEMAQRTTKQDSSPKEESRAMTQEPEEAEQPSDMLLTKPKLSVPMNACRKRSSITARAGSTSSSGPERKKEQTSALLDVKPAISWKQSDKSSEKAEELPSTKKKRKERFRAGAKNNSSKSSTNRSDVENNKNSGANSNTGPSTRGGTSNENSASKSDKKNNSSNASAKKQSAANFLNRMKRSSSSNNGTLLETLKETQHSRGGTDQKKNGGNKGNNKQKEQASLRKSSSGKQAKEQESPTKRSVGRPSKRQATAAPASVPAKRNRQSVEKEVTPSRNAKKRARK